MNLLTSYHLALRFNADLSTTKSVTIKGICLCISLTLLNLQRFTLLTPVVPLYHLLLNLTIL